MQTVTRAIETELEPEGIYAVLAEAGNIPKWAPVFADSLEAMGELRYRVTKGEEKFEMEVRLHPSAGAVDYVRQMPGGRKGGAYVRVTPRPLGGSTICMTVPVGPGSSDAEVGRVVEQELEALVKLGRG